MGARAHEHQGQARAPDERCKIFHALLMIKLRSISARRTILLDDSATTI